MRKLALTFAVSLAALASSASVRALAHDMYGGKAGAWQLKRHDETGDNSAYMPDHCHPNAQGCAEVWLPALLPCFREMCGKQG